MNKLSNFQMSSFSAAAYSCWGDSFFGNNHMGYYGNMGSFGAFGFFLSIIFWALIFAAIYYLVRNWKRENKTDESKALDILKERYAKGEITKEEFEEKKKDIEKK